MIEESEAARERLNRNRAKPLRCDFKYYFVDAEALHVVPLTNRCKYNWSLLLLTDFVSVTYEPMNRLRI